MSSVAESQVSDLESSIGQVQDQIDSYTEQIDGIENGLCAPAETDLTDYLDNTKLAEVEADYGDPFNTPFSVDYGANYGSISYTTGGITDFRIIDSTGNTMYEYNGVNWDSDATITKLVGDFAFGNDYLTKPLAGGGASYGLYDNLSGMTSAKNLLTADKNKISSSVSVFEDYL
jgi:hypothetical protein